MTCKIRAAKRFDPRGVVEMDDRAQLPMNKTKGQPVSVLLNIFKRGAARIGEQEADSSTYKKVLSSQT